MKEGWWGKRGRMVGGGREEGEREGGRMVGLRGEEGKREGGRRVGGRKNPKIFKHPASLVQNVIKC